MQAEIMKEEMMSAEETEYTAKSLPLLLHQVRLARLWLINSKRTLNYTPFRNQTRYKDMNCQKCVIIIRMNIVPHKIYENQNKWHEKSKIDIQLISYIISRMYNLIFISVVVMKVLLGTLNYYLIFFSTLLHWILFLHSTILIRFTS